LDKIVEKRMGTDSFRKSVDCFYLIAEAIDTWKLYIHHTQRYVCNSG